MVQDEEEREMGGETEKKDSKEPNIAKLKLYFM